LREEFLRYLRLEDTFCLFRNLIERPAIADRPAVREFLERSVGTVFTSGHTDDPLRIAILQSRLISDEAKRDAIQNHPALEGLVDCLTNNFGPELRRPLVWTLNELQGGLPTGVWTRVLDILGASGASDLINAVAKLCSDRLESASEASAFLIVSQICDLFGIVDEHAPESRRLLETALESFGRKISVLGASIAPDAMVRGVRAEMETHQREARQEADKLANLNNALNAEVLSVRREAQRLLELVDTLKSSAAFDRHELQTTSRIEAVRPFLLLLDDLHRQSVSASAPLRSLIDQVENALTRAGLEQIGVAGGTLTFDASLHEFADEPGQVPTLASVRVVRPGYTVFEGTGRRIVRRALVRPAW
jgi:molecular chaperone GrpE (heat shock protein)